MVPRRDTISGLLERLMPGWREVSGPAITPSSPIPAAAPAGLKLFHSPFEVKVSSPDRLTDDNAVAFLAEKAGVVRPVVVDKLFLLRS